MSEAENDTIRLQGLALGYPGRTLFENVDLSFGRGELTALIGRNGTGKSTLLRTIMGLLRPLRGSILIGQKSVHELPQRMIAAQISFVSTDDVRMGHLKVYDVVGLGRAPYTNWIGRLTDADRAAVEESLRLVGMEAFGDKGIDTLSDGERQRVMIARSLAQDTPMILLDEPTAFLDLPNKYEIGLLLRSLAHNHGKTILFSTHDLNITLDLCDRIVMIDRGKFLHGTPDEMIANGSIGHLFDGTSIRFDREKGAVSLTPEKKPAFGQHAVKY
ncbi:ABC transporter ATP-binding protein [Alistipes indistinctus]|mgnify:FL=1|jgi:iron complex transport system ATP-binding protein|uniref:ABC transporter ATP-binding protein n=1 Tax=Alistipes indistinctus TaxID=626932 RepID=UPI00266F5368|nr:ABC transporter ATP-binding protein [Alistipes indistinctus]